MAYTETSVHVTYVLFPASFIKHSTYKYINDMKCSKYIKLINVNFALHGGIPILRSYYVYHIKNLIMLVIKFVSFSEHIRTFRRVVFASYNLHRLTCNVFPRELFAPKHGVTSHKIWLNIQKHRCDNLTRLHNSSRASAVSSLAVVSVLQYNNYAVSAIQLPVSVAKTAISDLIGFHGEGTERLKWQLSDVRFCLCVFLP